MLNFKCQRDISVFSMEYICCLTGSVRRNISRHLSKFIQMFLVSDKFEIACHRRNTEEPKVVYFSDEQLGMDRVNKTF